MTEETAEAVAAAEEEVVPQEAEAEETQEGHEGEHAQMSKSKERREQRKAEAARIRASEEDARNRLSEAEARLDRIRAAAERLPEPKESDFDKYEDYLSAKTAYASVKALNGQSAADIEAEIEERRRAVAVTQAQKKQELAIGWQEHVSEARSRYSDFDNVVFSPAVPITERVATAIMSTEAPADVAYRLASDPVLAREISAMSDLEVGRTLGRIEASLSRPRPKTETSAPSPITPVKPVGTAVKDPSNMSYAEYKAARQSGAIR